MAGLLIPLGIMRSQLYLFFFVGFLGCFSTFSSFVYNLFNLLIEKQYVRFIKHYLEVIIWSSIFFYVGFLVTKFIDNWSLFS